MLKNYNADSCNAYFHTVPIIAILQSSSPRNPWKQQNHRTTILPIQKWLNPNSYLHCQFEHAALSDESREQIPSRHPALDLRISQICLILMRTAKAGNLIYVFAEM